MRDVERRSPSRQVSINIRMSVEEREELRKHAAAQGVAVSDLILRLIAWTKIGLWADGDDAA